MLTVDQKNHIAHGLAIVSIHIPAYNEAFALPNCLRSLLDQNCPKDWFEVVVVDNNSSDQTCEVTQDFKSKYPEVKLHYLMEKKQGVQYARKTGMDFGLAHKAMILAGTDADDILKPQHISNIIETMNIAKLDGFVGQRDISISIKNAYSWYQDYWTIRNALKRIWASFVGEEFDGNCFAITSEMYKKVGGLPIHPDWPAGEDVALSEALIKKGGRIVFSEKYPVIVSDRRFRPNSKIVHSHLPIEAGGGGFPVVRDNDATPEYPMLTPEEVSDKFNGQFNSFVKRLMRRVVSQHISGEEPMSKESYNRLLSELNDGVDFIEADTTVNQGNFWQLSESLYGRFKKPISKKLKEIFKKSYPDLALLAGKYNIF